MGVHMDFMDRGLTGVIEGCEEGLIVIRVSGVAGENSLMGVLG